uniref:Gamma-secretase subunit APH-1 n=1 Tax=Latimeria chalumnae TaxID=7897 RepID=H3AJI4_LATCH
MGAAVFFGCTFIAFGPAFSLFVITVAGDPLRVIILVAGPQGITFWRKSTLHLMVLFVFIPSFEDRFAKKVQYYKNYIYIYSLKPSPSTSRVQYNFFFLIFRKADEGLAAISEDGKSPISIQQMAYVSGLSFGIISGAFSLINILADSIGPGTVGIHGDSPHYFITSGNLRRGVDFCFNVLTVFCFVRGGGSKYWTVSFSKLKLHSAAEATTFLNPWYAGSLIPISMLTVSTGIWAFFTAGGSLQNLHRCATCKADMDSQVLVYSALQTPADD